ncbi:MAG: carbohydrate ABC transporter substrate-binding protein, partial [Eubacterium sp.]|nr:carbohydrate ABC transporter substrate-binding protein [Eubacterium sp.]
MKKTIGMTVAVLMILGLAACGAEKQEATVEESTVKESTAEEAASEETASEEATSEEAASEVATSEEATSEEAASEEAAAEGAAAEEGFQPSLDASTSCQITVAGGYDNFEALEAEFDRFNEYYPDVELTFTKVDDFNNMIGTVLNGNDAPDIYVNYSWMYGREQYASSIDHAENLADPALGLDLDCIRSNIILKTDDDTLPMVPVFANTYGMLVNNDLFEKEGLSVPTTYQELVEVCEAFREKGYASPMMGFSNEETTSVFTLTAYPFFCGTVAQDAEAVEKLNALDPSAGE